MPSPVRSAALLALLAALAAPAAAQQPSTGARPAAPRSDDARPAARAVSAPISNVRYTVTFDDTTARTRTIRVAMTFDVGGPGPVLLSLPAWTPGAYGIENFARWVSGFTPIAGGRTLDWDKHDFDTWRVDPAGASSVTVAFDYRAESFDNSAAWTTGDFAFFNGTTVFLYPEGRGFDWGATVTVRTRPEWRVATGMTPAGAPRTYRESNYHDLVDMPFFVGRFEIDSMRIVDRWVRMATYPEGALGAQMRQRIWGQLRAMFPPAVQVFGDVPFRTYTVLQVIDSSFGGGSGLEHQNSHVDLLSPLGVGSPIFASLYAHEIFHAWNVKRLRPAELWPYDYDEPQPTPLLWMSEGITDYYADLMMIRGGLYDASGFYATTANKLSTVDRNPPVALEDASLETWIKPVDGEYSIYYDKGSLAGLLIDIMIRDASDNRRSLDDVLRELYRTTYQQGRGFTTEDFWRAASRAAGGRSFDDFHRRYIDGREPMPFDSILPLAAMRLIYDSLRVPQMGVGSIAEVAGVRISEIDPGGPAAESGLQVGDLLVSVGDIRVEDQFWGARFRARYAQSEGQRIPIVVRRGDRTLTLSAPVRTVVRVTRTVGAAANPSPKALRIRNGLFTGTTSGSTSTEPTTR